MITGIGVRGCRDYIDDVSGRVTRLVRHHMDVVIDKTFGKCVGTVRHYRRYLFTVRCIRSQFQQFSCSPHRFRQTPPWHVAIDNLPALQVVSLADPACGAVEPKGETMRQQRGEKIDAFIDQSLPATRFSHCQQALSGLADKFQCMTGIAENYAIVILPWLIDSIDRFDEIILP